MSKQDFITKARKLENTKNTLTARPAQRDSRHRDRRDIVSNDRETLKGSHSRLLLSRKKVNSFRLKDSPESVPTHPCRDSQHRWEAFHTIPPDPFVTFGYSLWSQKLPFLHLLFEFLPGYGQGVLRESQKEKPVRSNFPVTGSLNAEALSAERAR
jgi:hypothetical protein